METNSNGNLPRVEADTPITDDNQDEYDRLLFRDAVLGILKTDCRDGLVVGIDSPWGYGKTSMKNMLANELGKEKEISVVDFNPWMYSGSRKLVSLLFLEISRILNPKTQKAKERFWKISRASQMVADGVPLVDTKNANLFAKLAETLNPDKDDLGHLSSVKKKLVKKLEKCEGRLIVFIDDIDRLLDAEIADLIQTVKAVGDLPKVTYVLLYDRQAVTAALDHVYHQEGARFLEKIVQVPIRLPEPPGEQLIQNIEKELKRLTRRENYSTRYEIKEFCLSPFIHTKRDERRLLNEFRLRYFILKDDVEPEDLLGITSIELFAPSLYDWIRSNPEILARSERSSFYGQSTEEWQNYYKEVELVMSQSFPDQNDRRQYEVDVRAAGSLFPVFKSVMDRKESVWGIIEDLDGKRSICSSEHFEAYFRLSLPGGQLHESDYKRLILQDNLTGNNVPEPDQVRVLRHPAFPSKVRRYLVCGSIDSSDSDARFADILDICIKADSLRLGGDYFYFASNSLPLAVTSSFMSDGGPVRHTSKQRYLTVVRTCFSSQYVEAITLGVRLLMHAIQEKPQSNEQLLHELRAFQSQSMQQHVLPVAPLVFTLDNETLREGCNDIESRLLGLKDSDKLIGYPLESEHLRFCVKAEMVIFSQSLENQTAALLGLKRNSKPEAFIEACLDILPKQNSEFQKSEENKTCWALLRDIFTEEEYQRARKLYVSRQER